MINNFISITRPIFNYSKIGGFNLFAIDLNKKSLLPYKKHEIIDKFLFTLLLSVNLYLLHRNVQSINDGNILHLFVIDRGLKIILTISLSNSIYVLIWNLMNSANVLIIFKNFIQFDNEVCHYLSFDYCKIFVSHFNYMIYMDRLKT